MATALLVDQFRFFSIHDFSRTGSIHWSWERDAADEAAAGERTFDTFAEAVADASSHGFSEVSLPHDMRLSDLIDLAPRRDRRSPARRSRKP